jgi:WD40 repeat protein
MSIRNTQIYAGAPNTERGRPTNLKAAPTKHGKKLIYGSGTNVVIRDLANPMQVDIYTGHAHKVTAAAFSPSGYYVCSGDEGGVVRIWATDNVDKTLKLEIQPLSGAIRDIGWTSDSQRVIVVGEGKGTYAHVFLWDSGSPVGEISGHSKGILSCDVRQDRPFRIVTGGEDMSVNFYKGPPFKFSHSHKDVHTNFVNCVRYSPNSEKFVTVSSDKTGYIFEGKEGTKIGALADGHKMTIYGVTWTSDSSKVVTASSDKTVKVWDANSRNVVSTITVGTNIEDQQVGITRADDIICSVSLNGDLNILDIVNAKVDRVISGHNNKIYKLVYNQEAKTFYTSGADGVVIAWNYGKGSKARVTGKGHTAAVNCMQLYNNELVTTSVQNCIRFIPLDTFEYSKEEIKLEGSPSDIAVHGDVILVSTHKGVAILKNKQLINEQSDFGFEVTSVDIAKDGERVVLGGSDKKARLYEFDGTKLTKKAEYETHRGRITKVAFSPDSSLVAVGDSNREIVVYNTDNQSVKYNGLVFHTSQITDLAWSPNGEYLASAAVEKNVIVWNLKEQKRAITDIAHLGGVTAVAFVPDEENTLLTAGNDLCIKTWQFSF